MSSFPFTFLDLIEFGNAARFLQTFASYIRASLSVPPSLHIVNSINSIHLHFICFDSFIQWNQTDPAALSILTHSVPLVPSLQLIFLETIYSIISISFNFDSILDIIDCYQSQCCQLNLSEKSGKIYTTGKHLFCSIPMHCILSRKFSGSNSSVKSICNPITLIVSIYMVNTIFP